jgi:hypothetical protein
MEKEIALFRRSERDYKIFLYANCRVSCYAWNFSIYKAFDINHCKWNERKKGRERGMRVRHKKNQNMYVKALYGGMYTENTRAKLRVVIGF